MREASSINYQPLKAMEAKELFAEIEAFVKRTKQEAMMKPGIAQDKHSYLMGPHSKYKDPTYRGSCTLYFGSNGYYTIEIVMEGVYFRPCISNDVVSFDNNTATSFYEYKDEILSIWERAISRTTLSLYEQELETLIVQRDTKHKELQKLDHEIGQLKRKIQSANTSSITP